METDLYQAMMNTLAYWTA